MIANELANKSVNSYVVGLVATHSRNRTDSHHYHHMFISPDTHRILCCKRIAIYSEQLDQEVLINSKIF